MHGLGERHLLIFRSCSIPHEFLMNLGREPSFQQLDLRDNSEGVNAEVLRSLGPPPNLQIFSVNCVLPETESTGVIFEDFKFLREVELRNCWLKLVS